MPVRLIVDLDDRFEIGHRLFGVFAGIDQRQILGVRALAVAGGPIGARQIQASRMILLDPDKRATTAFPLPPTRRPAPDVPNGPGLRHGQRPVWRSGPV